MGTTSAATRGGNSVTGATSALSGDARRLLARAHAPGLASGRVGALAWSARPVTSMPSLEGARGSAWRIAEVVEGALEAPHVRTLVLAAPGWPGHRAGQHLDVRLTADDGYQAHRSYSLASAPGEPVAITVERLADGEVSPYLVDELRPGDRIEIRGPIGGHFVWDAADGGPLLLAAGGSGVVPLMAMIRHRTRSASRAPARLLLSSRSWEDVIFREELAELAARADGLEVVHTLTRSQPPGWNGYRRRVDPQLLHEVAWPPDERARAFVCGPTEFVEAVGAALVELGYPPELVKTERFGPTGT
jgi:ferredoxin-NADP reductase